MSGELDTTRAVRAWLQEGVTRLPDRVLDEVLADVPQTPQRRRTGRDAGSWRRSTGVRLLVAVMTLVVIAGAVALAAGTFRAPVPRPFDIRPLDPGRYVIDRPFPVRISLDLPAGWQGADLGSEIAAVSRVDEEANPGGLSFMTVDAVYPDPCHWDEASIEVVSPGTAALVDALATLEGVGVTSPTDVQLGGYGARTMTLTAPGDFSGCSPSEPPFQIWGHPVGHWLTPGERNQVWVTEIGSTRLVVSSEVFPETPPAVATEIEAIIASIRFEEFAAVPVPTPPPSLTPATPPEPEWPLADKGVPLWRTGFYQNVPVYEYDGAGVPHAVRPFLAAAFEGQPGWFGDDPGIVSAVDEPDARLAWWSIAKVYLDPCRWQTSELGTADPLLMRDRDGLAAALSAWWPTVSDPKVSPSYQPAPGAPVVVASPKLIVAFGLTQAIDLEIPAAIDPATCDGGEYRIWEAIDGRTRTARPGEQIHLEVADFEPGVLVVDTASLPTASGATLDALRAARGSLFLGRVSGRRL